MDWLNEGSADYILCSNVIHHVPEPALLFKLLSERLSRGSDANSHLPESKPHLDEADGPMASDPWSGSFYPSSRF